MQVRAFYRAATIDQIYPPYNTIHLKVFYPAPSSGKDLELNQGIVPANPELAPFPVVILFNGVNCHPEGYNWLAVNLAQRGIVCLTFARVGEDLPGLVGLTPGVNAEMLSPETYGTNPTALALPALLAELERINQDSLLAGLLNLEKVIVGGHSAGARVAMESASPDFFPQVVASFGYGVHTAAVTMLGYKPATILPLPDALPLLLIGGTRDGVIANSGNRYGTVWEKPVTPVVRTFAEAIAGGRDDSYLLLVEGANHFTLSHPVDPTTSQAFLDFPSTQSEAALRSLISAMIGLFIEAHVCGQPQALTTLEQYLASPPPLVQDLQRK
jgi:alpha-beta hydrolase superfamily lysophospholipase